jgi:hypothetical protein
MMLRVGGFKASPASLQDSRAYIALLQARAADRVLDRCERGAGALAAHAHFAVSVAVQCTGEAGTASAAAACVWLGMSVCPACNEVNLAGACRYARLRSTLSLRGAQAELRSSGHFALMLRAGPQAAQGQPRRGGAGGARRRSGAARGGKEDGMRQLAGRRHARLLWRAHRAASGVLARAEVRGRQAAPVVGMPPGVRLWAASKAAASPSQGPAARLHSSPLLGSTVVGGSSHAGRRTAPLRPQRGPALAAAPRPNVAQSGPPWRARPARVTVSGRLQCSVGRQPVLGRWQPQGVWGRLRGCAEQSVLHSMHGVCLEAGTRDRRCMATWGGHTRLSSPEPRAVGSSTWVHAMLPCRCWGAYRGVAPAHAARHMGQGRRAARADDPR